MKLKLAQFFTKILEMKNVSYSRELGTISQGQKKS